MSDTTQDSQEFIRQQVDIIAQPQLRALGVEPPVQAVTHPNKVAKLEPTVVLIFLVFIVSVGSVFFLYRGQSNSQPSFSHVPATPVQPVQPYSQVTPLAPLVEQRPQVNNGQDQRFVELNQRMEEVEKRIWLLGIANNENSVVGRRLAEANKRPDLAEKFILFDKDWNLNKVPEFQSMSDEDRRNLLKFVNPNYNPTSRR